MHRTQRTERGSPTVSAGLSIGPAEPAKALPHGSEHLPGLVASAEKKPGGEFLHGCHSSPPAPPQSAPVFVQHGRIVRRPKARQPKRAGIALPARIVRGLLVVPVVLHQIEFHRRVAIVRAARALMRHGVSQNHSADALHVSRSRLSEWLSKESREGEEALRPAPWKAGRHPQQGRQRRHNAFLELAIR